jgi:tRNA A-37 threonylcarbamoyl transferase component Bud32/ribosomal protein L40E
MTTRTCPKCGATLPESGAPCRRCLLGLALEPKSMAEPESAASGARRAPAPPPTPAELAPLFPELELEAQIGAGGMGAVYRARQRRLGRVVALKVLHGELTSDPVFVERFLREAQAMARLAHPGIVSVHDFGERGGRCFLVMEHVDGANLRVLLREGRLGSRQALDVVRQLCDALQFAHDEGVVHRDIKPENVLVDTHGRVKVADFGLAKLLGPNASQTLTDAGQVMGTPHYMAPEQVERPRDVDHRADLFSLGVVFYEMLTGELPLGRFAPPSQRVQIDVRLDEIVLKSLERERERRYQQAAQVKTAVERVERESAASETAAATATAPPTGLPSSIAPAGILEKELGEELGVPMRSGAYLPDLEALLGRPSEWGWASLAAVAFAACAASFALGTLPFLAISLPVLSWLYLSMVRARAGLERAPDERLGRWVVHLPVGAFALAALGLAVLFVADVSCWERWTWDYVSSPQGAMAGLERIRGNEIELLRQLGVSPEERGLAPGDVRLEIVSSHWVSNPYALFAVYPLVLAALAVALLLAAGWLVLPESTRARLSWGRGLASSLVLFLCAFLAVHLGAFAVDGRRQRLEAVRAARECRGEADVLSSELYQALVADELEIHAQHSAHIVDRRSGAELALVEVLAAAPSELQERWQLTPAGPRRLVPHVIYTLVSDPASGRAQLSADAGLLDPAHEHIDDWRVKLGSQLGEACAGGG